MTEDDSNSYPRISVVVPVHDGAAYVTSFVTSMIAQRYPRGKFEIIIIDNNSSDSAASDAHEGLRRGGVNTKLLHFGDFPSSHQSRNVGVQAAAGEILAFTDFDCQPYDNWLERIASSLRRGTILAGRVDLKIIDPHNYWEIFDQQSHMRNDWKSTRGQIATANMAVFLDDFFAIGQFPPVISGGDHSWSGVAKEKGFDIKYCKSIIVEHPTRKTYDDIKKKLLRISQGSAQLAIGRPLTAFRGALLCVARLPLMPRNTCIPVLSLCSYLNFRRQFFILRILQLSVFIRTLSFGNRQ